MLLCICTFKAFKVLIVLFILIVAFWVFFFFFLSKKSLIKNIQGIWNKISGWFWITSKLKIHKITLKSFSKVFFLGLIITCYNQLLLMIKKIVFCCCLICNNFIYLCYYFAWGCFSNLYRSQNPMLSYQEI